MSKKREAVQKSPPGLCFIRVKSDALLQAFRQLLSALRGFLPRQIQKHRQKSVINPSDGVSVCLKAEELGYFRDCEEGDVQ